MTVTSSIPEPMTFSGPSLSPSRAADFKTCPLLFRFRTIDKLPERPSADQVRGTLVHAVLESLFDLPAVERTPAAAAALVAPSWERLLAQEPSLSELFDAPPAAGAVEGTLDGPAGDGALDLDGPTATGAVDGAPGGAAAGDVVAGAATRDVVAEALPGTESLAATEPAQLADFLAGAADLLHGYFAVEDPRRFEPAERESLINTLVDDELLIRGYIDRLDVSPSGDLRVVDYKTGGAPREAFEGRALFQLKFYALVLWRTRGVVPRVLRLLYLKDAEICDYSPDADELERFERTLVALSHAIERAKRERDFRPKPSRLCGWCSHQAFCPEFGGTPPPYPEPAAVDAGTAATTRGIPGQAARSSADPGAEVAYSVAAGAAAPGTSAAGTAAAGAVVASPVAARPVAVDAVTVITRVVDPTDDDM